MEKPCFALKKGRKMPFRGGRGGVWGRGVAGLGGMAYLCGVEFEK